MVGFIVLGNMNAITYKEVFPLIKEGKMFTGYNFNKTMLFSLSDKYEKYVTIENGVKYGKVSSCCWYTNINIKKDKQIVLTKSYYKNPELYPKYDNYDAIEVSRVKNIPMDYDGVMGVPITFLGVYNPDQFQILGSPDADVLPEGWNGMSENFVKLYYEQGNTGQLNEGNRLASFIYEGKAVVPFTRILIKKKDDLIPTQENNKFAEIS